MLEYIKKNHIGILTLIKRFRSGIIIRSGGRMNKLKDFRNHVGVTQKHIADLVGVGQGTIDRYESGARKVSIETAWKLVAVLNSLGANCTFDEVFPDPQSNHINLTE